MRKRSSLMYGSLSIALAAATAFATIPSCTPQGADTLDFEEGTAEAETASHLDPDEDVVQDALSMLEKGRRTFRFDTFGDQEFWGGRLRLNEAIAGAANGGVGPGVSPRQALEVGLKVDVDALSNTLLQRLEQGLVDLDDPKTTLLLLQRDAVVGVKGFFGRNGRLKSIGIQCALCHSTVDDSFQPGIGHRLDGWPARDLDVGRLISIAPDLSYFADLLHVDQATVRAVFLSWGRGRFDAELILDGKAFRPDGKTASTVIPAAFGLAGDNLHTYTGWGSVPHWNAFVSNLLMHGKGTFYDPRLNNPGKFPIAADPENHFYDVRTKPDLITPKLASLQFYQLALKAPEPPADSFDEEAAERGKKLFKHKADCARCHVPPLFTEPGWNMHTPAEIGIDSFQADRSPDGHYRTTPLKGLFTRMKGGFYHDGRFPKLRDVVDHYDELFDLHLTNAQKNDLVEYLKSL